MVASQPFSHHWGRAQPPINKSEKGAGAEPWRTTSRSPAARSAGQSRGRIARKARALLVLSAPLLLTLVVQNVRANNRATSATPAAAVDPAAARVAAATFAADYLSYTDRRGPQRTCRH